MTAIPEEYLNQFSVESMELRSFRYALVTSLSPRWKSSCQITVVELMWRRTDGACGKTLLKRVEKEDS
jgi:hypothetical protein